MLTATIYVSFLTVAVLVLLPAGQARLARGTALLGALIGLVCALGGVMEYLGGIEEEGATVDGVLVLTKAAWVPALGIDYFLGVDGISLAMVVLTGLASVVGILFSWNIEHRAKEFFAYYLALIGGVYGVFLSFDIFLLFVFYEIAIIPKYFLIAIWGSTRREYGAMKLALYSFAGSALVLIGLVAAFVVSGMDTFNLVELAKFPFPEEFQLWAFPMVFVGFAVLAGMWPFHTWAPTGHVAAPTAASMLLAGVVMKLGAYGAFRVAMTLFPMGLMAWREEVAMLAVVGIVYGAMVALTQKDFKFVIGYSSVSHMGFVILGLMTLTEIGLSGAVLQMFSHGIIAGLLFAVVGRMVYDRTHTRQLDILQGLRLSKVMPFAAFTFVVAALASMGMPGFSGFIAELKVLIGAWEAFPTLAVISGVGILIGVAYSLKAIQSAFFSGERNPQLEDLEEISDPAEERAMPPISLPERIGAVVLIAVTLVIGLFPGILLDWILPSLHSPLFEGMRKGMGW